MRSKARVRTLSTGSMVCCLGLMACWAPDTAQYVADSSPPPRLKPEHSLVRSSRVFRSFFAAGGRMVAVDSEGGMRLFDARPHSQERARGRPIDASAFPRGSRPAAALDGSLIVTHRRLFDEDDNYELEVWSLQLSGAHQRIRTVRCRHPKGRYSLGGNDCPPFVEAELRRLGVGARHQGGSLSLSSSNALNRLAGIRGQRFVSADGVRPLSDGVAGQIHVRASNGKLRASRSFDDGQLMDASVRPGGNGLAVATTEALYFANADLETVQSIPGHWTAVAWIRPEWCLATRDLGNPKAWECSLDLVRCTDAKIVQSIDLHQYPLHVAVSPGANRVLVTLQDRVLTFRLQ